MIGSGDAVLPRPRARGMGAVARMLLIGACLAAPATEAGAQAAKASAPRPASRPMAPHAPRSTASRPAAASKAAEKRMPEQIIHAARDFEDVGAWGRAAIEWRAARPLVARDGDLELALALDEARSGQLDSAAARLAGPVLTAAGLDTLPVERYQHYGPERDPLYLTGRFEGWHWYVWRARAEVAMAQRRWEEATVAARRCVAARPFTGKEWLLLALCAGQAGYADEARDAGRQAATLDGTLPEAHYLNGVWAWRDGRRAEAQSAFRAAVACDSAFNPGVLALVRSRFPGVAPDSLPVRFLTGAREAGVLSSPAGPKLEQFVQLESAAILGHKEDPVLSDSLKQVLRNVRMPLWLLVDRDGRVVLNDLGSVRPGQYPPSLIADLTVRLSRWTFLPPKIHGEPRAAWIDVLYAFPL